jgi:hypothetical protein
MGSILYLGFSTDGYSFTQQTISRLAVLPSTRTLYFFANLIANIIFFIFLYQFLTQIELTQFSFVYILFIVIATVSFLLPFFRLDNAETLHYILAYIYFGLFSFSVFFFGLDIYIQGRSILGLLNIIFTILAIIISIILLQIFNYPGYAQLSYIISNYVWHISVTYFIIGE